MNRNKSKVDVSRRRGLHRRRRFRPMTTTLEDRTLLSTTFEVTSTLDDGSTGTLRWAVIQADSTGNAGSTITFNLSPSPATIDLTQGQLQLSQSVTIDDGTARRWSPSAAAATAESSRSTPE